MTASKGQGAPACGLLGPCRCEHSHADRPFATASALFHNASYKGAPQSHVRERNVQARAKAPQPVDFWVPAGVSVVTLTGPNTGGKTASLKALGLAAAMSKAGLFLPLQLPTDGESTKFTHYRVKHSACCLSFAAGCPLFITSCTQQ